MKNTLEELYEHRRKSKPQLTEEVFSQYTKIEKVFLDMKFSILEDTESQIQEIPMIDLKRFGANYPELAQLVEEWSALDVRVANSIEYSAVVEKMEELKILSFKLESEREDKILAVKKLFSAYISELKRKLLDLNDKKIEAEEIGYSSFKPYVEKYLGEDCLIKNLREVGSPEELFDSIKDDSLISMLDKDKIIESSRGYIDVLELEDVQPLLFELLRTEALKSFCEENFSHTPKPDQIRTQIEITPGTDLGKDMNLDSGQLVFVNLSLERFSVDFEGIKDRLKGKVMSMSDGRQYSLDTSSKIRAEEVVVKRKRLNGDILYIKVPLYIRHTVFNLISSQKIKKR